MSQQPLEKSQHNSDSQLETQVNNDLDEITISPTQPQRNYSLPLGIVIGVVATLLGVKLWGGNPAPESTTSNTPMATSVTSSVSQQSITTTTAQVIKVADKIEATGTVLPDELIPVMSPANNLQIESVLVEKGDIVKQGQILLRLDDSLLQAELKQAQAVVKQAQARLAELKAGAREEELARAKENINIIESEILQAQADLQLAQTKLERNRQLEAEGAIAKDRLDEFINDELVKKSNLARNKARLREAKQRLLELQRGARQEVIAQAQASLTEAQQRVNVIKTRLEDAIVTAPVSGKIAQRNAKVGDIASASSSQPLVTIIEDGRLNLEVKVPENELNKIAPQQKVQIFSTANPDLNLTGIVSYINPIIDRESRQGIVNVDLPFNDDLQAGMFVQVNIITNSSDRLTIPVAAVIPQNNGQGTVYLLQDDNTVQAESVSLGKIVDNEAIEVLSGLQAGDTIALKGVNYLQDGNKVNIIEN